jgi:hypothetical protein
VDRHGKMLEAVGFTVDVVVVVDDDVDQSSSSLNDFLTHSFRKNSLVSRTDSILDPKVFLDGGTDLINRLDDPFSTIYGIRFRYLGSCR